MFKLSIHYRVNMCPLFLFPLLVPRGKNGSRKVCFFSQQKMNLNPGKLTPWATCLTRRRGKMFSQALMYSSLFGAKSLLFQNIFPLVFSLLVSFLLHFRLGFLLPLIFVLSTYLFLLFYLLLFFHVCLFVCFLVAGLISSSSCKSLCKIVIV